MGLDVSRVPEKIGWDVSRVPETIGWDVSRVPETIAPPEFSQWPQSLSRPGGGSAEFSCSASGEPQPHIIWLKNGKLLSQSGTVRLSNGNTTLSITQISPEDEAIYQCIAENSAGSNQASARLSISLSILQGPDPPLSISLQGPDLSISLQGPDPPLSISLQGPDPPLSISLQGPDLSISLQGLQDPDLSGAPAPPSGLQAEALAPSSLTLSWERPPEREELHIIGYVLHVRRLGEPDSAELQEAVSKNTFSHDVQHLEPSTTYSVYLKAYSTQGGSRQSSTITCTTQGGVPSPPSFFSKVLNQTAIQVFWELPGEPGKLEGFRLEYRGVSNPEVQGQETFPAHINTHTLSHLERLAVYEIRLLAFNGNGDGPSNQRLVSLSEGNAAAAGCECSSGSALLVGVHSALACVLCCLLLLGYRRSFLCRKSAGREAPPTLCDVKATKGYTPESMELSQRPDSAPPVTLMVETVEPDQPGTSTG
ncbi:hypothetical protein NQZ68_032018 [Dissostichus eleginoides]|nr:hypothetical protein NQZ68_032018 [Dissostichus eleginoides]